MPLVGCPGRFREPSSMVVSHAWTPELVLAFSTHLRGSWRGNPRTSPQSCCFSPGLIAPKLLWLQHRSQGRDAHVKMNIKQWTDTSIWGVGVGEVYNHNTGKTSVAALLLAEPDHAPKRDPRWHSRMCLSCKYSSRWSSRWSSSQWSEPAPGTWRRWSRGRGAGQLCSVGGTGPQSPKSPTKPAKHPRQQHRPPTWLSHQLSYHPLEIYMWVFQPSFPEHSTTIST